ncbi:hypothetical protein EDB87DRAFT_1645019 [Lactarius vividus]|nr:hypothetical protein EDB87DRAFT_1645019 [Lactarius vividus]
MRQLCHIKFLCMCVNLSKGALSAARSHMLLKIHVKGSPAKGEPFDVESIYVFTFSEDDHSKFSILGTFDDSKAYPWAK